MSSPKNTFVVPNLPQIDLYKDFFEKFIKERGLKVRWEKAVLCPCGRADEATGTPTFNCGNCYNGNQYIDPQNIIATVTNITGQRNAQLFGDLFQGGVFLTTSGDNRLGIQDRIVLTQQTHRYSEMCNLTQTTARAQAVAGATAITVDSTRRFPVPKDPSGFITLQVGTNIIRYSGKTATQLTGIPATGAGSILSTIAVNTPIYLMEYSVRYQATQFIDARKLTPSGQTVELVKDVDFEFVEDRRIRFFVDKFVERFSVTYESYPVYLVDSLAHEFRDQITKVGVPFPFMERFPVAAVLRKDWMNRVG